MLGESDFTHSDLLRGHNQYVGRSLKVNGPFKRILTMLPKTVIAKKGGSSHQHPKRQRKK
ncbi:hypothetical protein A6J63_024795 [Yersinia enterocolitica]|nr:hypothetical protein A6J63_024795 [Yersinia enterocolitica]